MDLNQYLRTIVNNKVRPLFVKDKCEVCGSADDLHWHHVVEFNAIVESTLNELNLKYRNTDKYSDVELNLIINVVLGKHLQIEYMTLCNCCHKDIHKADWKNITVNDKHDQYYRVYRKKKEIERKQYDNNILIPYLSDNVGKIFLNVKDRQELIEKINIKYGSRTVRSIDKLNVKLEEIDCNYRIKQYSTSRMINGKKKNFRSAWKIINI